MMPQPLGAEHICVFMPSLSEIYQKKNSYKKPHALLSGI